MKRTEAMVGAFVLVCVAILCAAVFLIGNTRFIGAHVPFYTYLRYAGGIEPGTPVLFGGITVGKVVDVAPDASDPTRIKVDIHVKAGTPLNAKSVAKLGSVSLLGDSVVSITTGANDAPRLPPGAVIPSEETISLDDLQRKLVAVADSAQNTLTTLATDVDRITDGTAEVLSNLGDATNADNRRHLAGILANADSAVAKLSPKMDQLSDAVMKVAGHADAAFSNADATITSLHDPIQASLGELRAALEQARTLIGSMQAVVRANSDDIHDMVENLLKASDNLKDVTDSVKQRPWSLVWAKQPKDRKVPQE
jgi:phospholipid/cholesterol/gamma-HCH transport system substrate-binding protein